MPMIYVTDKTNGIIKKLIKELQKNTNNLPSRIVKADVIHVALVEYAKKLGLKMGD